MTTVNPYAAPTAGDIGADTAAPYEPKVFAISGRIGRLRYLAYGLLWGLAIFGIAIVAAGLLGALLGVGGAIVGAGLAYIAMLAPSFILAVRRLNDLDQSGWWSLLLLLPLANLAVALYMLFWPGTVGSNRFGPAPIANSPAVIVGAVLVPSLMILGIITSILVPLLVSSDMAMESFDYDSGFEYYAE